MKNFSKFFRDIRSDSYWQSAVFLVVFGVVGTILLVVSHAGTPSASAELENGTVQAPATVITDTTASGGKAIQFGAGSSGGGTGQGFISRSGSQLMLNGAAFKYAGFDFSSAANGCQNGGTLPTNTQLNNFFSWLPANSVTRIWAFDNMSKTAIDNVINIASSHHQYLILSLSDGQSSCGDTDGWNGSDGSRKSGSWFSGGYQTIYIPWITYMAQTYKNNPTIAMWEIQNEGDANVAVGNTSASTFISFMTTAANTLKTNDPNHLVESGAMGPNWTMPSGYCTQLAAIGNLDVNSEHDYDYEHTSSSYPSRIDSGNGEATLSCTVAQNKATIIGESGIPASFGLNVRSNADYQKLECYIGRTGLAGVNLWSYVDPTNNQGDQYTMTDNDPVFNMLLSAPPVTAASGDCSPSGPITGHP